MSSAFDDMIEMFEDITNIEVDDEMREEFAQIFEEVCGEPAH